MRIPRVTLGVSGRQGKLPTLELNTLEPPEPEWIANGRDSIALSEPKDWMLLDSHSQLIHSRNLRAAPATCLPCRMCLTR